MSHLTTIQSDHLSRAWEQVLKEIIRYGEDVWIGDVHEKRKIREVCANIKFGHPAIEQMYGLDVHPKFPSGKQFIKQHVDEYLIRDGNYNPHNFDYTYINQMRNYDMGDRKVDQLANMREAIREEQQDPDLCNNRHVVLVADLNLIDKKHPTCLQLLQLRRIEGKYYSLRLVFRSHDYGSAILSNLCGLATCIQQIVLEPIGCELREIILTSQSAHVYETDRDIVEDVTGLDWDTRKPVNKTRRKTIQSIQEEDITNTTDRLIERCKEYMRWRK